jgi:hypothetical protein
VLDSGIVVFWGVFQKAVGPRRVPPREGRSDLVLVQVITPWKGCSATTELIAYARKAKRSAIYSDGPPEMPSNFCKGMPEPKTQPDL